VVIFIRRWFLGNVYPRRKKVKIPPVPRSKEGMKALVTHSLVFVLGVSTGLIISLVGGNLWLMSAFVLGLGLILGYYARQQQRM